MVKNFENFIKAVDIEVKKAKIGHQNAKTSAEEIAASAAGSPSQAGDRFHSQGTADIAKQKLDTAIALKEELQQKREKICFEFQNETIFVVDNPIFITGFRVVSSSSPLGQKMLEINN